MPSYNLHAGHAAYGKGACGAVGSYLNESVENRRVRDEITRLFNIADITYYDCTVDTGTQSQVLKGIIKKCNAHKVDLDISLHFDSGSASANGTSVIIKSGTDKAMAQKIVNSIAELGFKNRGVSERNDLYFLNKAKSKAVLIECCFVNNAKDYELYNPTTMAQAIVKAIIGYVPHVAPAEEKARPTEDGNNNVYRVYNPNSGEHFYTTNIAETNILIDAGWNYEGVAWIAPTEGESVHRLYNPNDGYHHYTRNADEATYLASVGWGYEGVVFLSGGNAPIYRIYNPNNGQHHYTTNKEEADKLILLGWNDEGVAFFSV